MARKNRSEKKTSFLETHYRICRRLLVHPVFGLDDARVLV